MRKYKKIVVANAWSINMLSKKSLVSFEPITLEEVKEIIKNADEILSIVGHVGTASVFSQLLDTEIKHNRVMYKMDKSDLMIVGVLGTQLPEGKILTAEDLANLPIQWWKVEQLV